jgi:hypothetical protein
MFLHTPEKKLKSQIFCTYLVLNWTIKGINFQVLKLSYNCIIILQHCTAKYLCTAWGIIFLINVLHCSSVCLSLRISLQTKSQGQCRVTLLPQFELIWDARCQVFERVKLDTVGFSKSYQKMSGFETN